MCVCRSIKPGITVMPVTSMTLAPLGHPVLPGGSIAAIVFRVTTSVAGRVSSPVASNRRPPRRTSEPSGPRGTEGSTGVRYFPKWSELAVTGMIIGIGFAAFGLAVKYLPIFPKEEVAVENSPEPSSVAVGAVMEHAGD